MQDRKRIVALLLCLCLVLALCAACGSNGGTAASSVAASDETAAAAASAAEAPAEPEAAAAPEAVEEPGSAAEASAEEPEAEPEPTLEPIEYPLFDEPHTYTIWLGTAPDLNDVVKNMEEFVIFRELEKVTNVTWEPTMVSFMAESEQFQLMLAGGDFTDVISGMWCARPSTTTPAPWTRPLRRISSST